MSGYRHMPLLVCPAGHSDTFKAEGISKTLMSGAYTRVNNQGKVIETHDPNVETHHYRCDVCGVSFTRRWQDGKLLLPEPVAVVTTALSQEELDALRRTTTGGLPETARPKTAPKMAVRMERAGWRQRVLKGR